MIRVLYIRCCQRSGGRRSWKAAEGVSCIILYDLVTKEEEELLRRLRLSETLQCEPLRASQRISLSSLVGPTESALTYHGVVLELRLAERGSVSSNDDQLRLSAPQALQSRLVAESDPEKTSQSACCFKMRMYFCEFL